jgi:Skp family chaperone for outer membrane proteins
MAMKRAYTMVLAIITAIVFTGGCQEEQVSSNVSLHRLIAAENRELKAQLQQETKKHDEEIKNLKTQLQTETKKRDDEIKTLKTQLQTKTKKRDDEIKTLKTQLQTKTKKRDDEIKTLKTRLQTETKKRDDDVQNLRKQLDQCEMSSDKKMNEEGERQCEKLVSDLMDGNTELTAEVEQLKNEMAKIKGEPAEPPALPRGEQPDANANQEAF